jgi:hypothetical protein
MIRRVLDRVAQVLLVLFGMWLLDFLRRRSRPIRGYRDRERPLPRRPGRR